MVPRGRLLAAVPAGMTTLLATRRQWMQLPVEHKDQQGTRRYIVIDGRRVPVVFVKHEKDSHLTQAGIDTKANGQ